MAQNAVIDIRPIAHVMGWLLLFMATLMLVPAALDLADRREDASAFLLSAGMTGFVGGLVTLATSNHGGRGLDTRQAFLLTAAIWAVLPLFGSLPFMLGPPRLAFIDAYFESVSGITTTGATVIVGLDSLPPGINLWRGLLNWTGGLGIAFVAMIFLPVMRVGGMQFFRTEGFDTMGKILPRAADIARSLVLVYVGLTAVVILSYRLAGMTGLDSAVNGLATVSTGGFSPSDASFSKYPGLAEYLGGVFMLLSALPYIRFVQMTRGDTGALLRDSQVRALIRWFSGMVVAVSLWQVATTSMPLEQALRETFFNISSILTGTGFFSGSFASWEGMSMIVAFIAGIIGGCSGSSSGALSVFRVQLCLRAIGYQLRRIRDPNGIHRIKYGGRSVAPDVLDALILFVTGFVLTMGVLAVALSLVGVDPVSALFAAWTSLGNIGYGYGPLVLRTGTFIDFPDPAIWLMIVAMILGRLGLLTLLVLMLPRFWLR
jgi:trk system potassium uptake protein TrkH